MKESSSRHGFTLVELLLFTGIISIMAGAIVGFSLVSGNIASRNEIISEVEQNGDVVLQRILRSVGELADAILYPDYGEAANALVLAGGGSEYVFYQHGDRIAFVEDGNVSYLTTGDVVFDNLGFLHYGEEGGAEGVSVVFSAGNRAVGTEMTENQFARVFRGSASLRAEACINATCGAGEECCRGDCYTSPCCDVDADCVTPPDLICCISNLAGKIVSCEELYTDCECATLADCPIVAPYCDTATCKYKVPTCNAGKCDVKDSDLPCDQCSTCGDGIVDVMMGEECDDGNGINDDACTTSCKDAECGDGYWQELGADGGAGGGDDEECDDGNNKDGDGCSSDCLDEDLCVGGSPDETVEGDEECDDNNLVDTDTCDSNCRLTTCNDGIVQSPNGMGLNEECEKDSECTASEFCSGCLCVDDDICGNGVTEGIEECDDGKRCTDNGDPCQDDADCANNDCAGFSGDGCTTPDVCVPSQSPNELTCNDGIDNDCNNGADCADAADCPATTACQGGGKCYSGTCCGDGAADAGEECNEPGKSCTLPATCNNNTCRCVAAIECGDWLKEGAEECDDGNTNNGDGCSSICELPGSCGSCPDCPTAAENWSLTVAGIVDIPGDPSSCTGGCNKYNGVFSLPYAQLENISECNGSCLWCWGDSGNSGCDALNPIWTLYYDSLNSKYVLNTGADGTPWYSISEASWNCNGANTLTKEAGPVTNCQTWPETIQVTPQGVRECTP